ncbi:hypothetical protein [Kutzneria chonburiensis]|uniref:Translation initiation factor 2 n=1 Tax=Kutzneria chonburiensis TaxID=1483604 RepID=A0ABV6MWW3_9PSEU|nr:hypothetical protein [Kutzneria chonburiensis]
MSKSDDPERLLAEALRAQAVSTPVTMPPLPAVLTKAEDAAEAEPDKAAEEPDEAVSAEEPADEPPADEPAKPAAGTGEGAFTEEMVLRELSSGPMTGELATIRINNSQQHYETERFSPLENLYGGVGDGPGFGLISGSEVGSTVGPPVGEFDHLRPSARATTAVPTTRMKAERGQVPGWLILLFALVLGLAGGAVAGLLSMV